VNSMPGDISSKEEFVESEMSIIRQECDDLIRSWVGGTLLVGLWAANPYVAPHLRLGNVVCCLIAIAGLFPALWVRRTTDCKLLIQRSLYLEVIMYTVRLATHLLWILIDRDYLFWKVITVMALPLSSARQSQRFRAFKVYLLIHVLLCVYRFHDVYREEGAWIASALIACALFKDAAAQKDRERTMRCLLREAYAANDTMHQRIQRMAQSNLLSALTYFCDAEVILNANAQLSDASDRLDALLMRNISAGQDFLDCVDYSDREKVALEIESFLNVGDIIKTQEDDASSDEPQAVYMKSVEAHFNDKCSTPFPVQSFLASVPSSDGTRIIVGISEKRHVPNAAKKGHKSKQRRETLTRLNFETGLLEPCTPQWPQDFEPTPMASLLASSAEPHLRHRADSPSPHHWAD